MMDKYVHVCTTPALIDQFDVSRGIVVVIDILRATTSISVAFGNGVDCMVPVEKVEDCRKYKEKGYLIAGERDGVTIEGFDLGNSPYSYMSEEIRGKKIAITTTNGTKAAKAAQARNAKAIVTGAFSNISILSRWLVEQEEDVCLLCAGWRDNFTIEDTIFAGAMVKKLRQNGYLRYQDTALMAETLYNSANTRKRYFIRSSSHRRRLEALNLQEDVKYAMRRDTQNVIPLMKGDTLYNIL